MTQNPNTHDVISYGKAIFYSTLVGKVYKFLKKHTEATTIQLIHQLKSKEFNKSNGRNYSFHDESSIRKALLGLSSTNIFIIDKDTQKLSLCRAKEYKHKKVRKYYNKSVKHNFKLPLLGKRTKLFKKVKLMQRRS